MCPHVTDASFSLPESASQMTSRLVQPFLHSSEQCRWACPGMSFPQKTAPSPAELDSHLIHASALAHLSSSPKQHLDWFSCFCTAHISTSLSLKIAPFHGGSGPTSNTWFLGPTRVLNPNRISIGSAVCAGLNTVTDIHTDKPVGFYGPIAHRSSERP